MMGPKKRSIMLWGHATSVTLEPLFWEQLGTMARQEGVSLAQLIQNVDSDRSGNLSSTLRVLVVKNLLTNLEKYVRVSKDDT